VQTEKGKRIIEFCQIAGIFKIQIDRLFDFFYYLTGQRCLAALPRPQNRYGRIILLNKIFERLAQNSFSAP
jgi:hypothetical protein